MGTSPANIPMRRRCCGSLLELSGRIALLKKHRSRTKPHSIWPQVCHAWPGLWRCSKMQLSVHIARLIHVKNQSPRACIWRFSSFLRRCFGVVLSACASSGAGAGERCGILGYFDGHVSISRWQWPGPPAPALFSVGQRRPAALSTNEIARRGRRTVEQTRIQYFGRICASGRVRRPGGTFAGVPTVFHSPKTKHCFFLQWGLRRTAHANERKAS